MLNKTVSAIALSALVAGMSSAAFITTPAEAKTKEVRVSGIITTSAAKSKVKKVGFLSPVIVDKAGYAKDSVVARKQTGVVYRLNYNRKTGYYTITGTTKRGFIFTNGKSKITKKGKLNTNSITLQPDRPGTIDRTGYVNDELLLPKKTSTLNYVLNYHNKPTGEWKVSVYTVSGYKFDNGSQSMVMYGKFNTLGNNGGETPPPVDPPIPPPLPPVEPPPPPVEVKEPVKPEPKTCDELVKVWRPANVPASFPITCVDKFPGDVNNTFAGALYSEGINGDYYYPYEMKIRRGMDVPTLKMVMTHESWHYESFSWSREKQRAYLDSVGASVWQAGDITKWNEYISMAAEMWAGMGTECSGYKDSNFYKPLPGGCATIQKWAGSLYKQEVK